MKSHNFLLLESCQDCALPGQKSNLNWNESFQDCTSKWSKSGKHFDSEDAASRKKPKVTDQGMARVRRELQADKQTARAVELDSFKSQQSFKKLGLTSLPKDSESGLD